jgi:hypothetical protein
VVEQDRDVFVGGAQPDLGQAVVERDDVQAGGGADPVGAVAGAAEGPDDGLELGGGGAVGVVQQQRFEFGGGDAGDRADLGVGQGAGGEPGADRGEFAEPQRDPDLFAGGGRGDPDGPGQPLGGGAGALAGPVPADHELGDQSQPPAGQCRELGRAGAQVVFDLGVAAVRELGIRPQPGRVLEQLLPAHLVGVHVTLPIPTFGHATDAVRHLGASSQRSSPGGARSTV